MISKHPDPEATVENLSIRVVGSHHLIVEGVSFSVKAGEVLGLVGESGSGKTTTALALLGHFRPGLEKCSGSITVGGEDPTSLDGPRLAQFRGARISYVAQDPTAALNPALRVRTQLREILTSHGGRLRELGITDIDARMAELLEEADLSRVPGVLDRYPHQLSGGQQQRVVLAMAFALRPSVIVLDEPTTGLDVTTQRHVLETVRQLTARYKVAGVFVSHDLAVVSSLSDSVCVFRHGRIVEAGLCTTVFNAPQNQYTRELIAATPRANTPRAHRPVLAATCNLSRIHSAPHPNTVLDVAGLEARYGRKTVLSNISFTVNKQSCVAIVGESGSGKTTLARCIIGLHPSWNGAVTLEGSSIARSIRKRPKALLRRIQYVFQNPYTSLNPRKTVRTILEQPLRHFNHNLSRADRNTQVIEALRDVALAEPLASRYPSQLSGGERQRVAIARALIAKPDLIVCDEITSALDVSVQAQILRLLEHLQQEHELAIMFITHNMAVVRSFADSVAVISKGRIVEFGETETVFNHPANPYTASLLDDTPTFSGSWADTDTADDLDISV